MTRGQRPLSQYCQAQGWYTLWNCGEKNMNTTNSKNRTPKSHQKSHFSIVHCTYEGNFPLAFVSFVNIDCSILNDDNTAELFQKVEAGVAVDIFGMTTPPSKSTESASDCSSLQATQIPDLGKEAKKFCVTFVTFCDSCFQLISFWILHDAIFWASNQRVSMLDLASMTTGFKTLVELKRDWLSLNTVRILVAWKLPATRKWAGHGSKHCTSENGFGFWVKPDESAMAVHALPASGITNIWA